ncbi:MAG: hypothetical protein IJ501_03470 [Bacilli bacterium]|nr:hypothetical protein [Bacilli bacterium]
MEFLKLYGLNDIEINKLYIKYSKALINSIIYKKENVLLILNYFKEKEFDLKTIILNRLDLFLINFNHLKEKIEKYNEERIINWLKDDISLIDSLN